MRSVPDGIDNCGVERFCKSCPSRTQMLFLGNSLHTGTVKMFHATSFSCVKWRVFDTTNTPLALQVPYMRKPPFDSVPHAFHARPCGSSVPGIIPATAKLSEMQCPACFWAQSMRMQSKYIFRRMHSVSSRGLQPALFNSGKADRRGVTRIKCTNASQVHPLHVY
jgi:hypothetical protein